MRRNVIWWLILFIAYPKGVTAQQDIYLFIDSTTIIGKISDNKVYTSPSEISYSITGNIIFTGDSNATDMMLFTIDAKDILSKKVGLIFQADGKTVQYITMHSSFYLGDHPIDKDNECLLTLTPVNDSITEVYSGIDESRIGVIEGKFSNQPQIVAAAHLYIRHYAIDDSIRRIMSVIETPRNVSQNGFIHPKFDRGPYYEWVWDGQTLKPYWGYRPEDEWVFDGKYLKPAWSADPRTEWIWDGSILKPFWDAGVEHQWVWKDNMLKPFWDNNPDLQWVMEEDIIRPMWRFNDAEEWVVEGNVPLPILAIVILGIADR